MNNLERFTSPASGANIKTLLKELSDKGAQLRSLLWLETRTTSTPVAQECTCDEEGMDDGDECDFCCDERNDPGEIDSCQLELSVGSNVVLTELYADQINQILPKIKEWVVADLEAIEKRLNAQGVFLEGPGANQAQVHAPILPLKPFDPSNIQFLSKRPEKGDLVLTLEEIVIAHPVHANDSAIILKKGVKCRVLDVETQLLGNVELVHIQPETGLDIYRVNTLSIQPIQE